MPAHELELPLHSRHGRRLRLRVQRRELPRRRLEARLQLLSARALRRAFAHHLVAEPRCERAALNGVAARGGDVGGELTPPGLGGGVGRDRLPRKQDELVLGARALAVQVQQVRAQLVRRAG